MDEIIAAFQKVVYPLTVGEDRIDEHYQNMQAYAYNLNIVKWHEDFDEEDSFFYWSYDKYIPNSIGYDIIEKGNLEDIVIDVLKEWHNKSVRDNKDQFIKSNEKHKYMPFELVGWKNFKDIVTIIKSMFECSQIEINEKELENIYNNRLKDFFLSHDIKGTDDLVEIISTGEEFYPDLSEYGEILEKIKNSEFVRNQIIPDIETKGIGKVENVRDKILQKIIKKPTGTDIERLTPDEQELVKSKIEQEIEVVAKLDNKDKMIMQILALAHVRKALKNEIALTDKDNKEK